MDEIEVATACPKCEEVFTAHEQTDEVPLPDAVLVSLYRQGKIKANDLETFTLSDLYTLILNEEASAAA